MSTKPGPFHPGHNLRLLWQRPPGTIAVLDGLRALSVLWVIAFHWVLQIAIDPLPGDHSLGLLTEPARTMADEVSRAWYMKWLLSGDLGVDVFLLLSGFLIAHLLHLEHAREGGLRIGRFLGRRWLRIAPAYFAVLLLYQGDPGQKAICAEHGWSNLLFVNNFVGPQASKHACMAHSWSLAVEMQFYLLSPWLIPWLAKASTRQLLLRVLGILAVAQLWQGWVIAEHWGQPLALWFNDTLYSKPLTRLPPYLVGAVVALLYARSRPGASDAPLLAWPAGRLRVLDALAGAAVVALGFAGAGDHVHEYLLDHDPFRPGNLWLLWLGRALFAGALGWLLLAMLHGRLAPLQRLLAARVWVPVAGLSYALYLIQYVALLPMLQKAGPALNATRSHGAFLLTSFGWLGGAFALAVVVALFLHLLVERPVMNLRKK